MTTDRARAWLLSLLPPGYDNWFDFTPGSDGDLLLKSAADGLVNAVVTHADDVASDASPLTLTVLGCVSWEQALGLAGGVSSFSSSLPRRIAAIVSKLRESGASTRTNILASAQVLTGQTLAIIEHTRASKCTDNTYHINGAPATIPASGFVDLLIPVADNAPVSDAGAQVVVSITHPQSSGLSFRLTAPDGFSVSWGSYLTGSITDTALAFGSPLFAGHLTTGAWTLRVTDASGNAGAVVAGSFDGLFVEGVGRDVITGADGLGARVFEWSLRFDPTATGSAGLATVGEVVDLARRWNPAHALGGVTLIQSDAGTTALVEDTFCLADLCTAS